MIDRVHLDTALTLDQYRALDLTRPYTDLAIGAYTDGRRSNDAFCSSLHDDPSPLPVGWTNTLGDKVTFTNGSDGLSQSASARRTRASRQRARAGEAAVRPVEPRNGPTGTSTTPRTENGL